MRASWILVPLLVTAPAAAQPATSPPPPRPIGVYAGVEPGEAQPPPAYPRVARRRARRSSVILTWPGFAPLPGGGSRFFVQTTDPTAPELRVESGRVVLLFRNTSIHVRNSGRWLETRFFNTPVVRARLERRRRDMALVLYMRAASQGITPSVRTEVAPGGAFHYVYVDFPPGDYAPVATEAPAAEGWVRASDEGAPEGDEGPPPAPARELDPSLEAMDDERPPGQ